MTFEMYESILQKVISLQQFDINPDPQNLLSCWVQALSSLIHFIAGQSKENLSINKCH